MEDEQSVTLVKRVMVRIETKHKTGCTGQVTITSDGSHTADCSSCGPVEVTSAEVEG